MSATGTVTIVCPRCGMPLTEADVKKIWAQYCSNQRKTRSGGRNGGRPKKEAK